MMRRACGGLALGFCLLLLLAATAPAQASAATYYVNSPADDTSTDAATLIAGCDAVTSDATRPGTGTTCTLRGALDAVNANGGANTIEFSACGPYEVTAQLPTVPADTTLNGSAALTDEADFDFDCSEEYYTWYPSDATTWDADPTNADCLEAADIPWQPECGSRNYGFALILGPGAPQTFPGLVFDGAGSTATGIFVGGFSNAIVFGPPGEDTFEDGFVGNDPFEQGPLNPPNTGNGIEVETGSANDIIGYSAAADGSTYYGTDIYGNGGWGIYLEKGSGPTTMGGDFVGTDTTGDQYAVDGPQPGDDPADGTPVLDGNGAGGIYDDGSDDLIGGNVVCTGSNVCTSNIIAGNQGPGVEFGPDATSDQVASNFIGESLDFYDSPIADDGPLANADAGVIDQGSDDTIGGSDPADANQISGNAGPGVELEGSGALVGNNLIGLNFGGTAADANQGPGVLTSEANQVPSGNSRILDNTIGGNTGPGVELDQADDSVLSNYIGFAGDHSTALGNSLGILATAGTQSIGGVTSGANVIANNAGAGVAVTAPPSTPTAYPVSVDIEDNSIFDNRGLGIDLGNDGVTTNHVPDTTSGPNDWTNYPVITSVSEANDAWTVHGTLDALPSMYYNILLFGDQSCDPSGYGPGQTLEGGGSLTTNSSGSASFVISGTGTLPPVVSATTLGFNGTSEFSACVNVGGAVSLSATQSVSGSVIAGDPVDVDVHMANAGPARATNVELTLTVPSDVSIASPPAGCPAPNGDTFTCNVGSIAAGSSLDAHVLLEPKIGAQTLTDSVQLTADQVDQGTAVSALATAVTPNPSAPTSVNESIAEPNPTYEQLLRLNRESGTVTATLPNGERIELKNYALIPSGTVVSTTGGVAKVTAAVRGGKTSFANFKYGKFKITQPRGAGGLVKATMNGSLAGCPANDLSTSKVEPALSYSPAADVFAAVKTKPKKKHKPTTRTLWGHDSGGSYEIAGNRGAATVQGTTFQVVDHCSTTTVIVYSDSVKVTGFGNTVPKSATVTAGHRLVLRAAR